MKYTIDIDEETVSVLGMVLSAGAFPEGTSIETFLSIYLRKQCGFLGKLLVNPDMLEAAFSLMEEFQIR